MRKAADPKSTACEVHVGWDGCEGRSSNTVIVLLALLDFHDSMFNRRVS